MTVAATTNRKTYTGDNVTTSFATSPVIFYATSDLQVRVTVIATGVSTLLTLNTHYTVTGGSSAGAVGTVSLAGGSSPHGALLSTEKLVIIRVLPLTQGVDFVNNNNSDAEVIEAAFDKLTDVDQQIQEQADRSIRFASGDVSGSVTEIPDVTTRAGTLLGFDALGVMTTVIVTAGTTLVNFASSVGSSLIGFLQAGTGAILRTLQSVLRERLSVADYGAVGDGVTNDTVAITTANAAAVAAGKALYFPQTGNKYIYKPSATLNLSVDWYSDNQGQSAGTQIEVDTATLGAGVYFQMITGCEIRNIYFQQKGNTKVGTGLKIEASNPANFVSFPYLKRVWIIGFNKNIDCGQSFNAVFDRVRLQNGTEGFYCVPTGYVNTHLHISPYYDSNTRNVHYLPSVNSSNVGFKNGAIQNATGATAQAGFQNLIALSIKDLYMEGASGIPAIALAACSTVIDGLTLTSTGALTLGANSNSIHLKNVQTAGANSVFTASGTGTQTVTIDTCAFPASGNTLAAQIQTIINSIINGITYGTPFFGSPASAASGQNFSLINAQIRQDLQIATVSGAGATDVYRFLDAVGTLLTPSLAGRFLINVVDTSTGANQAQYIYDLTSSGNGTTDAVLTQIARHVRGTDPGTSATPFAVANDGGGGGLKLQFTKNAAITSVRLRVMFVGTVTNTI